MNSKKFSEAMSELGTKYVDEAINYKKKISKPIWAKWGAIAACLCLIVGAVVLFKYGISNPPVDDNKIVLQNDPSEDLVSNTKEDTTVPSLTETIDASPVYYSSLMLTDSVLNEEALALFSSSSLMDIKEFDESTLSQDHCCMIIEGTVVNLYVKHYTYDIYSDKFEENGILHGKTDTVVYEVAVDKTWYGEDISGETILIEDTSYFIEPILAVKEGGRYVLPLYEYGDSIWTLGHEYAGGDIARETAYSTIYPYHPQIEVIGDGSYFVSQDWTTLVEKNAKEVIMDTLDDEDYWKDKMYLVDENTFASQMTILIESILIGG